MSLDLTNGINWEYSAANKRTNPVLIVPKQLGWSIQYSPLRKSLKLWLF